MQGKLLTEKLDAVTLLFYMAPWAALMLGCLALMSEGLLPIMLLIQGLAGAVRGVPYVILMLIASGLNACLLNVANFLVTAYTSAVTLQVLGNVKSCLSIAISVAIFRNQLLPAQTFGVVTCLFGVWVYNKYGGTVKRVAQTAVELAAPADCDGVVASGGDHAVNGLPSHKQTRSS